MGAALAPDSDILGTSRSFSFAFTSYTSVYVKPVTGEKEHTED
jgi:hypothetical protein